MSNSFGNTGEDLFKLYFAARIRDILAKYGNTEQARILVGTYTIIAVLSPDELPAIISKRTLYRHLEMLKAVRVGFSESYRKEVIKAYRKKAKEGVF